MQLSVRRFIDNVRRGLRDSGVDSTVLDKDGLVRNVAEIELCGKCGDASSDAKMSLANFVAAFLSQPVAGAKAVNRESTDLSNVRRPAGITWRESVDLTTFSKFAAHQVEVLVALGRMRIAALAALPTVTKASCSVPSLRAEPFVHSAERQIQHFLLQTLTAMCTSRGGRWFGSTRSVLRHDRPDVTPIAWNTMIQRLAKMAASASPELESFVRSLEVDALSASSKKFAFSSWADWCTRLVFRTFLQSQQPTLSDLLAVPLALICVEMQPVLPRRSANATGGTAKVVQDVQNALDFEQIGRVLSTLSKFVSC